MTRFDFPLGRGGATEVRKAVDHPQHYNAGNIETIDVIEDWNLNFNLGNVIKYVSRADHKGQAEADLRKALWYLERELKRRGYATKEEEA